MPTPQRYLCIHGHFYQPPRENPWLETVEIQPSAAPYHDWNDRITAECYARNGAARIVNAENQIVRIFNNYAHISFNFGPTLLSWLEENAPRTYRMIVDADHQSRQRFSGHGSAIAQAYNHIILPLAPTRDRITSIRWGIADFEHRFGRAPEGMWLAETAVDTESLDLLAGHGIRYVILAPHQCARIRPLATPDTVTAAHTAPPGTDFARHAVDAASSPAWTETPNASVETTRSYLVRLPSGRSIAAFFYDGPRSRAIAFEGLLNDGATFAQRLLSGFSENPGHPELVHVATDGESYGHHHRFGEMALAWTLQFIEQVGQARLTNYGEFLEKVPPIFEAAIVEDTSWSCAHGIERWRSDCGCNGGHAGWSQQWRAPLREALDWLRDAVAPLVRERAAGLFPNIDQARDAYIDVILNRTSPAQNSHGRSREAIDRFLARHATGSLAPAKAGAAPADDSLASTNVLAATNGLAPDAARSLTPAARIEALQLMELERHALLMYTSCGWFFDEISGIETVQIIAYASRVLQLAASLFGEPGAALETGFLARLAQAPSNLNEERDGAHTYDLHVRGMQVNLAQVAAHYAISSMFSSYADHTELFCYNIRRREYEVVTSGHGRLVIGIVRVRSHITEEQETVCFAVLHFGDQNITAAVRPYDPAQIAEYGEFVAEARDALTRADLPALIRAFDRFFAAPTYSLQSLFKDEQQRIVNLILKTTLTEVEASLMSIYEGQASLLRFLGQNGLPRPHALVTAATFAVNAGLRRALEAEPIDAPQARAWLGMARADQVTLDQPLLSYLADRRMKQVMVELQSEVAEEAGQTSTLEDALLIARTLRELPFELNLWQAQNLWYDSFRRIGRACAIDSSSWCRRFLELGKLLNIAVEELRFEEDTAEEEATPLLDIAT
jgi:alpha-amylase/alpha-mannosidase (GH57 family)